jgi:hypothetical protein
LLVLVNRLCQNAIEIAFDVFQPNLFLDSELAV